MTDRLAVLLENIPSGMDAVLITSDINRRYYLGFPSNAGTLLMTKDKNYFIIDGRYFEAAQDAVKNCEVILQDKLYAQLAELLKKHAVKTVGVEAHDLTLSKFARLQAGIGGVEIIQDERVSKLMIKQRGVKSGDEIENIMAAQDISDRAFSHILNFIKPGRTDREIMIELEQYARREGSEETAFQYIVAAGRYSSLPHAVPCGYEIKPGDFVTLDYGATVNGYRSDMTRTVAVGFVSDKQREVYEIVLKAQLAGLAAVRAGVCCSDVDKAARDIIDSTSYKGTFSHSLGHSFGLEIHEPPRFSQDCTDILEANTVMSVEPGIYLLREFGVRIEDIVVAEAGGYRNLVKSGKDLIIL